MKCAALLTASVILLISASTALSQRARIFDDPSSWDHPEQVIVSDDDIVFPNPLTTQFKSRAFYYTGVLLEGYAFIIHLFNWSTALFNGWGFTIQVADRDGNTYVYHGKIDTEAVLEAPQGFSVSFKDNLFTSSRDETRIRVRTDRFRCDLHIRNLLPPWKPGDGYAYLSDKNEIYMRKSVPLPLGKTSGIMILDDKVISAQGWGYGDCSLIVMPVSEMSFSSCSFRAFSEGGSPDGKPWFVGLLHYTSDKKHGSIEIPMLIVAHATQWIMSAKDYSFSLEDFAHDPRLGHAYPRRMCLRASSRGYFLEGCFVCEQVINFDDVSEKLPSLLRFVAVLFAKRPVIVRMLGTFEGTLIKPDGSVELLSLYGQGDYSSSQ